MQKVYLLLRNNQQSGPYDLEELLQLQLKPFDLVWVNGRSAAWQYPGEIPALQAFMPITPHTDVPFQPITTAAMERQQAQAKNITEPEIGKKKVFVSMPRTMTRPAPSENIQPEETEKEITIPDESYRFDTSEKYRETFTSAQAKPLKEEEEFIKNWNYIPPKKNKSMRSKDLVATLLLVGLIAGGYYLLSKPSIVPRAQVSKSTVVAIPVPVTEEKKIDDVATGNTQPAEQQNTVVTSQENPDKQAQKIKTVAKHPAVTTPTVKKGRNDAAVEKTPAETRNNTDIVLQPESTKSKAPAEVKKKKLGQAIKNIFSQKKKSEEPKNTSVVLEEPKPATDRKAARREDPPTSSNTTQVPEKNKEVVAEEENTGSLTDFIDITSNAPENWMMGISGLKITLRNRSNVVIQTAAVNVLYYDANNKLLDRKMVYFSHVPAKGKLTQPAPDHKWADHVEIKLSAASAKEDRYAKD